MQHSTHAYPRDIADRRGRKVSSGASRERGASLLEASLAVTLFGTLIILGNQLLVEESDRRQAITLGRDLRLVTLASQAYVRAEYEAIIKGMATGSAEENAEASFHMSEVAEAGFLPESFLTDGQRTNNFGQEYVILLRGVNASDDSVPKGTMTRAMIDPDLDGVIDPGLIDGNPANGELEIEAILVTVGGEPAPPVSGITAVVAAELVSAGFVESAGQATGPYRAWSLNLEEYAAFDDSPEVEHFVSLIALSGYGVFNQGGLAAAGYRGHPLERCLGLEDGTQSHRACTLGNEIFTEVVFNSHDTDADGKLDRFGTISNLYQLDMGPPVDADGDGVADLVSAINRLGTINCDEGGDDLPASGELQMNCDKVRLTGNLDVAGTLQVDSTLQVDGNALAMRYTADALGGLDLTKGVFHASLVSMGDNPTVPKPQCLDADSEPLIFAAPVSYATPSGYPLIGITAFAEHLTDTDAWKIGIEAMVDSDSDGDGSADVISLVDPEVRALVLTKCS